MLIHGYRIYSAQSPSRYCNYQFKYIRCDRLLVVFSYFEKKYLLLSCATSVHLSVRLSSVEIISFRGILISNRPIDLKMSMNVRKGVVHVRKAWFSEMRIASCNIFQFMLQFMQITKDIAVFPDNYHSCLSQLQLVAKRIVHSAQQGETTLNNIIHERYDFYAQ